MASDVLGQINVTYGLYVIATVVVASIPTIHSYLSNLVPSISLVAKYYIGRILG